MTRRYVEPVRVARFTPEGDGAPDRFLWRGRRYEVSGVLTGWQERRAWGGVGGVGGPTPSPQRHVWRVEARTRGREPGVFDLAREDDHWVLLRAHD